MDCDVLLICNYGSVGAVFKVSRSCSFMELVNMLNEKWLKLKFGSFSLFFSFCGHPRLILENDSDVENMFALIDSVGVGRVDLFVVDNGSSSNSCGDIVGHCESDATDVDSSWGLDDDTDFLSKYCRHQDRPLLSASWKHLIKQVDQKFEGGVFEFRIALRKYAIENGFKYRYVKNDLVRVSAECASKNSKGCEWYIHARKGVVNDFFYIRQLNNVHTCGVGVRTCRNPRVSSNLVSSEIVDRVRDRPLTRPVDVVGDFKNLYGLDISYHVAWTGVEKAKGELFGDHSSSFDDLLWYRDAVNSTNPGSIIDIEFEGENQFKRLFVAFHACIYGFNYCRPLLFLDGTFLKGRYKGCLLGATGKNGNDGLFPFAFAIVDAENHDNWKWFLQKLSKVLSQDRNMMFVSDRHVGLVNAMPLVFPNAHHCFCLNHLEKNFSDKLRGVPSGLRTTLVNKFKACAYLPTETSFRKELNELKDECGKNAAKFFESLDDDKWSSAHVKGLRYGEMSTNAAESFNSWIREPRNMPITKLVDMIRVKVMRLMSRRRVEGKRWKTAICPRFEAKLDKLFEKSRTYGVTESSDDIYEVHCDPSVSVDIASRTCSCFKWQINRIPCEHAMAVLRLAEKDLNLYVDPYFHVDMYRESYSCCIYPIPTAGKLGRIETEAIILPPSTKVPPGRPATKRIASRGEASSRRRKCGRCKEVGHHNRKTCKAAI